ncbi:MAG: family 10 glycosylhydrolase [Clostridia bacterium]|nr:family 10 glycosylhydrolase [Clostridia bacterium]
MKDILDLFVKYKSVSIVTAVSILLAVVVIVAVIILPSSENTPVDSTTENETEAVTETESEETTEEETLPPETLPPVTQPPVTQPPATEPPYVETAPPEPEYVYKPDESLNGVWIASVFNINFPSNKDLSPEELKKELDSIVATVKECGMDTIFFQVRPESDALYKSSIFPVSKYLSSNGKLTLDCLDYIIKAAHKENIKVHAWVNPMRVTSNKTDTLDTLPADHPARLHPEYTVPFSDGKIYYNLGIPAVRQLVCDGVREIVHNYDVDGIVFDDYFYPYPAYETDATGKKVLAKFDDEKEYDSYVASAGKKAKSLGDWRRSNVNSLVKSVYETVKSENADCLFGVSPFGIWKNGTGDKNGSLTKGMQSYSDLYCDSLAWVKGGYVDYISPQLYWTTDNESIPYKSLCDWWSARVKGTKVKLVVSHAAYKYESGWEDPEGEIEAQVDYADGKKGYFGSIFYGYQAIYDNIHGIKDELKEIYGG